jgi:hypothetical protein
METMGGPARMSYECYYNGTAINDQLGENCRRAIGPRNSVHAHGSPHPSLLPVFGGAVRYGAAC